MSAKLGLAFAFLWAMAAVLPAAAFPAADVETDASFPGESFDSAVDVDALVEERGFGARSFLDRLKQGMDRLVNKLVDEVGVKFPDLQRAIADFEQAVKDFKLHKLTHAAAMKTISAFTKALYDVRQKIAEIEGIDLSHVVLWLDERAREICWFLSLYHEDCGYPDIDAVGA